MSLGFEDIVAGVLEVSASDVADAAGPETLPAWTSLRHLELIVALEEAYGISFAYREIRDLQTVGDLRRAVLAKHAAEAGARSGERDGHPLVA